VRDERTISSTPILYHLRWISIEPLPFYHPQYGSADFNSTEKVLLSIANEKTYSLYIYPLKTKSVSKVAIYARVSTNRQDPDRQVRELESFVDREYPDADLERYVDIISGTTDGGGKKYQRLRDDIAVDELQAPSLFTSYLASHGSVGVRSTTSFSMPSNTTHPSVIWRSASLSTSTIAWLTRQ